MIKLTARYDREEELRKILSRYSNDEITAIHPPLTKPAKLQPSTGHLVRYVYIRLTDN